MVRVGDGVAKDLVLGGRLAALGRGLDLLGLDGERLVREERQSAPRVELTAGEVDVRRADGPAAEVLVGLLGLGPVRNVLGGGSVIELTVADVVLVLEGAPLGHDLVGAEVGGLEEALFSCQYDGFAMVYSEEDLPHSVQYW